MSTQIVSTNDGGRTVGISNFGDKKAAPFTKGKKRRKAVLAKAVAAKGKKWTKSSDDAWDAKHGVKEGSPQDKALDKKRGLTA